MKDFACLLVSELEKTGQLPEPVKKFLQAESLDLAQPEILDYFAFQAHPYPVWLEVDEPEPSGWQALNDKKISQLESRDWETLLTLSRRVDWDKPLEPKRRLLENILKKFQLSAPKLKALDYLSLLPLFCLCYRLSRDARFFNGMLWAFDYLRQLKPASDLLKAAGFYLKIAALVFQENLSLTGFHPMPRGGYR